MTLHIKGNSCQAHFISSYQGKLISRALHIKTDSLWTNSIVKNTLIFKRNLSQRPLHIKDNFYQAHFISTDVFGPKCCYCTVYAATAYHICHILLTAILYKGCGYHINQLRNFTLMLRKTKELDQPIGITYEVTSRTIGITH